MFFKERINLISRVGPNLEHHLFDSLNYIQAVPREGRFLDIGSGAGFPGIPLKIVLPNVQMALLESQRKRASFLKELIRTLKLGGVKVIHDRAENLHQSTTLLKQFDAVLFRGVGEPRVCILLGEPFLKPRGVLVLKQGVDYLGFTESRKMEKEREIRVKGLKGTFSKLVVFRKHSM